MARKVFALEDLSALELEEGALAEREMGEQRVFRTVQRIEVVCTVAYMLGVPEIRLGGYYGPRDAALLEKLCMDKAATIVRYLSKIRTNLLNHFLTVDSEIRFNLSNLDSMKYFDRTEIETLEEWGVHVLQPNCRADRYMYHITKLLDEHIDACKGFFPESVRFAYIRSLFVIPHYNKKQVLISEYNKYRGNKSLYPFQVYLYWHPEDSGNILHSDEKFLRLVYAQNGEQLMEARKFRDASKEVKQSIHNFICQSRRVVIVVDCENASPYKLYGVLKNLSEENLRIIQKIILYDDVNTTIAWDYIEKLIDIPVEHVEVPRVNAAKSLVDMQLAVGVTQAYYREKIDSFILCSSDSDFWGLITSIPKAKFLVMYEYRKCGSAIKEALSSRSIFHCAMDDFYMENAGELQQIVLKRVLKHHLPDIVGKNGRELTKQIFKEAYIAASENELERFYEKYIKRLRLRMGEEGKFEIVMEE